MHFPTWCLFFYFLGLIHPECRCRPPFTVPSLLCDSSHPSHHPPNINSLCHRLCRAFSHYHPPSSSFAHDCTPPVKGYPQAHEVCLTDGPLALQSALSARRAPPWTRHRARCLSGRRPPRITLQPPTARSLAKLHAATADTSLCGAAGHQQVCSSRASMGVSEANASIPAAVGDLEDSTPYKLFVGQARRRGPEYWPSPAALHCDFFSLRIPGWWAVRAPTGERGRARRPRAPNHGRCQRRSLPRTQPQPRCRPSCPLSRCR